MAGFSGQRSNRNTTHPYCNMNYEIYWKLGWLMTWPWNLAASSCNPLYKAPTQDPSITAQDFPTSQDGNNIPEMAMLSSRCFGCWVKYTSKKLRHQNRHSWIWMFKTILPFLALSFEKMFCFFKILRLQEDSVHIQCTYSMMIIAFTMIQLTPNPLIHS